MLAGRPATVAVVSVFIGLQLINHWHTRYYYNNNADDGIQHMLNGSPEIAGCSRNCSNVTTALDGPTESHRLPTASGTHPSVAVPDSRSPSSTATAHDATAQPSVSFNNNNNNNTMVPPETNSAHKRKPILFWHVGPHKTSTTAIQTFLYKRENGLKKQDNIVMPLHLPGRFRNLLAPANVAYCFFDYETWPNSWDECRGCELPRSVVSEDCEQVMLAFRHFVDNARVNSQNVLLSSEGFSTWNETQIQRLVHDYFADWDVQVIVYFRRWDEWLASVYFEWNRFKSPQVRLSSVDYFEDPATLSCTAFQYSHAVRQRYQAVTDSNVTVVNFHAPTEKRSLIEQFVCDALHGMAPHACRAAKTYVPTKINARYSLDADFVLARALATNLIPSVNHTDDGSIPDTEKDTPILLARIHEKLQKSVNLPVQCLSDNTQGYVWNRTREWFPFDRWPRSAPDQEEGRLRMCSLDASAVCQLADWRKFFQTIRVE
jgi:hypothetical protein